MIAHVVAEREKARARGPSGELRVIGANGSWTAAAAAADPGLTGGGVPPAASSPADTAAAPAVPVAMDRDARPWLDLVDNLRALGIEQVSERKSCEMRGGRGRGPATVT